MKKLQSKVSVTSLIVGMIAFFIVGQSIVTAQEVAPPESKGFITAPVVDSLLSDTVTINVKGANISEVLKAYSLQTGQSIVVGPDVVSDNVNVRLNNIHWEDALDVILQPYGFGYREVGKTIIISTLENINKTLNSAKEVEKIEPLESEVFRLKYLDAYDLRAICTAQLTARGKFTILETKSLPGWEFGGEGSSGAATESGIRSRKEKDDIQKSKIFVVTDIPTAILKIQRLIKEVDRLPEQVLIEAKFLEISAGDLSDIGLDHANVVENVEDLAAGSTATITPTLIDDDLVKILNLTTGFPAPLQTRAAGSYSQDNGIRLSHSVVGDWGAEVLFSFMAKDDNSNVLSAPKILTVNNQEASILVGQKFPIIESQNNSGSGSTVTSTSLDYYENIGIQLNVVPQVCDDDYINMIVHPAVSEIEGYEAGVVTAGSGVQSGSRYPVLRVREAETQIIIKSSHTAIIGGLQSERDKEVIKKVPLLGDIPYLGRLFRRETLTNEKVDLLIFIKATIVESESYSAASKTLGNNRKEKMKLKIFEQQAEMDSLINMEPEEDPDPSVALDDEVGEFSTLVEQLDVEL